MKLRMQPYPVDVYIYFSAEDYSKAHKRLTGKLPKTEGRSGQAILRNNEILIGIFNDSIITLVHEVNHAVIYTLEYIGHPITDETSEAFTYLVDYILNKTIKHVSLK